MIGRRDILEAGVVCLCLLMPIAAHARDRAALLISSNQGMISDAPLRHTHTDAQRFSRVLRELGRFAEEDITLLQEPAPRTLINNIRALQKRKKPLNVAVLYYSGHAQPGSLHISGHNTPVSQIMDAFEKVPAKFRLVVIDACHSGAATRTKGLTQAEPFEVHVEDVAEGQVLIASSAADERSFESDSGSGSVFTFHWTTGLRGAADQNRDARVTLSEAYHYAYNQTVRATLLSSTGPQHPTFRWELVGQRDPVLTYTRAASTLNLHAKEDTEYHIFNGSETELIAEIPISTGDSRRLALLPGEYVVRKRTSGKLQMARVKLQAGDDQVLHPHNMRDVPLIHLTRKGSWGRMGIKTSVTAASSGLGYTALPKGSIALEWEQLNSVFGLGFSFTGGEEEHALLKTDNLITGFEAWWLYLWRFGITSFGIGPSAAVEYFHRTTGFDSPRHSVGIRGGGTTLLNFDLTPSVALFFQGTGMAIGTKREDPEGLLITWWASGGGGARFTW